MTLLAGCLKGKSHAAPSEKTASQTQNKWEIACTCRKTVTIAELLKEPKTYDGQEVVVAGDLHQLLPDGRFLS